MSSSYYRGANIVIVVFGKNNRQSFENIERWVEESKRMTDHNASFILVGSKCDLESEVSTDEAIEMGLKHGMIYTEISVKTGTGVNEMFEVIIRDQFAKENEFFTSKLKIF